MDRNESALQRKSALHRRRMRFLASKTKTVNFSYFFGALLPHSITYFSIISTHERTNCQKIHTIEIRVSLFRQNEADSRDIDRFYPDYHRIYDGIETASSWR